MGEPDLRIADEHATGRVPTARPEQTVGEVRDSLAGADFDCADDVAVVADCALLGRGSLGGYLASTRGVSLWICQGVFRRRGRPRARGPVLPALVVRRS